MNVNEVIEMIDKKVADKEDMTDFFFALGREDKPKCVACIQDITKCDSETAEQAYDKFHQDFLDIKQSAQGNKSKYVPKCPTCGSPSVKKISGTKRWASAGLFGLGSSNIGKTMECNNCGYKW